MLPKDIEVSGITITVIIAYKNGPEESLDTSGPSILYRPASFLLQKIKLAKDNLTIYYCHLR